MLSDFEKNYNNCSKVKLTYLKNLLLIVNVYGLILHSD